LDIPVQPIATIWFMSLFVHVLPLHVLEVFPKPHDAILHSDHLPLSPLAHVGRVFFRRPENSVQVPYHLIFAAVSWFSIIILGFQQFLGSSAVSLTPRFRIALAIIKMKERALLQMKTLDSKIYAAFPYLNLLCSGLKMPISV
jgi:hypothetical protein